MGFTIIAAIRIEFDSPWCNEKNTQLLRKRHTRRRKTDRHTDRLTEATEYYKLQKHTAKERENKVEKERNITETKKCHRLLRCCWW